jgi:hypothetical protein
VFNQKIYLVGKGVSPAVVLLFLCVMMALLPSGVQAQKTRRDTIVSEFSTIDTAGLGYSKFRRSFAYKWNMSPHSPLKATLYSAVIPGAGQIYNGHKKEGSVFRKYWKVPIVYAGVGTCVGFIIFNDKQYKLYKAEYIASMTGGERTMGGTPNQLNQIQEQYHQWRDLSYLALAGVYLLQIIDANVDAHLFYHDVSRNLDLMIHPSVVNTGRVTPGLGLTLTF